jgi:hypothetical protein
MKIPCIPRRMKISFTFPGKYTQEIAKLQIIRQSAANEISTLGAWFPGD